MICLSSSSSTSSTTSMHLKKAQERKNVKKIFAIEGGKKILILCVLFFLQSNFIQVSSQTFTVCPDGVDLSRSDHDWCANGEYKCASGNYRGCAQCPGGKYMTYSAAQSADQKYSSTTICSGTEKCHRSTACLSCPDGEISSSDSESCVDCDSGKVPDTTGENCITPCKINEYLDALALECMACPILRYSQLGATAEADCKCAAGNYLEQDSVWYAHIFLFCFAPAPLSQRRYKNQKN